MSSLALQPASSRAASMWLTLATVFWGCGFSWAKVAGEAVNVATNLPPSDAYGQVWVLSARFVGASIVWFALFPGARTGWGWRGALGAIAAGLMLGAGMLVQHVGLARSSVEVSAFLTSLTVLFVPLMGVALFRERVSNALWLCVALSVAGIWLLTGASPQGFGVGEWLGLGCAVLFSAYFYVLNHVTLRDTGWRVNAGQFLSMGAMCLLVLVWLGGDHAPTASSLLHAQLFAPGVLQNVVLLVVLPTLGSFGLMTFFQPRIPATRAALIYMLEPLFAAAYAWFSRGNVLAGRAWLGAALILSANLGYELWGQARRRTRLPA